MSLEKMQRNFKPLIQKIDVWKNHNLSDNDARLLIYRAFVEEQTSLPKHLLRDVHHHYFEPEYEDFKPPQPVEFAKRIYFRNKKAGTRSTVPGSDGSSHIFQQPQLEAL